MNALIAAADIPTGLDSIRVVSAKAKVEVVYERDPRAFNSMDGETKLIHSRLEEWASWVRQWAGAQGYPAESYYHKWALLHVSPQPGHEPQLPERVAHVDAAVARLGDIDKSVIKRYYLGWRPVKIWSNLSGIANQHKFNVVLKRARWRVDGYLTAIEKVC